MTKTLVQFTRHYQQFNKGEVAGFDEATAARLVGQYKVAQAAPSDVLARHHARALAAAERPRRPRTSRPAAPGAGALLATIQRLSDLIERQTVLLAQLVERLPAAAEGAPEPIKTADAKPTGKGGPVVTR